MAYSHYFVFNRCYRGFEFERCRRMVLEVTPHDVIPSGTEFGTAV
jgi:hypothetical protein